MRGPSETVVGGDADEEGAAPDSEVVPGNVHMPIEWAGRVVVGPTRLSVSRALVVNAKVGPASRGGVPGSGGLEPAEALTAAGTVEPDGEPGGGWAVVQSNGVANGIGERALTAGGGEAGEGVAAIGGVRCAGDVDGGGVAAS